MIFDTFHNYRHGVPLYFLNQLSQVISELKDYFAWAPAESPEGRECRTCHCIRNPEFFGDRFGDGFYVCDVCWVAQSEKHNISLQPSICADGTFTPDFAYIAPILHPVETHEVQVSDDLVVPHRPPRWIVVYIGLGAYCYVKPTTLP